jgi:hypothetical protein
MTTIDTNIDNYTVSELLTILDIDDPTVENVTAATHKYIIKFTNEQNPAMVIFFQDMQTELIQYATELATSDEPAEYGPAQKQTTNWWQNESLTQTPNQSLGQTPQSVQNQTDKITDRKQKIKVYNNQHVPMTREQLGVNNTISVPVAQDTLNPNLKNTISQLINLDSQYRQTTSASDSSTDYTLDLSEPLLNVLSLKLYSFQIPYSWYTIDIVYGNTCFWIIPVDPTTNQMQVFTTSEYTGETQVGICISMPEGNYTSVTFPPALNQALYNAGFNTLPNPANNPALSTDPVTINIANGKLTLNLNNLVYTNPIITDPPLEHATISTTTSLVFFDPTAEFVCTTRCSQTLAINQSLGWIMGFRLPNILVQPSPGNVGAAVVDLYGPKYLIMVLDDYNQNHINNGLIGISEPSNILKLPSYYSPDMPYTCTRANPTPTNLQTNSLELSTDIDAGTLLMDKLNATYSPTQQILPSAPRTLTQTQIYTINEILKNNEKTYNYRVTSPTTPNTFALIPVKNSGMKTGDVYVDFGGSLQDNKRVYFGPVNITRLRLKLLDDKGNVLNLNGGNWCVTLMSENLYQY